MALDYRFEGKFRTLSFGAYPELTLADARARRLEAKALLAKGIDPGTRRRKGGFEPQGDSFEKTGARVARAQLPQAEHLCRLRDVAA